MKWRFNRNFLLPLIIITGAILKLSAQAEIDSKAFMNGDKYIFRTGGHPKSKGLDISVQIPASWEKAEGDRPNVVQKFTKKYSSNSVICILIIKKADMPDVSKSEAREILMDIAEFAPEGATVLSSNPNLLIDGEPAGAIEYSFKRSAESNPMNTELNAHGLTYMLIYKNYVASLQFYVTSSSSSTYNDEFSNYKPLFASIAGRLVINTKWK